MSTLLDMPEWFEGLLAGIGELLTNIIRFLMPFFYWLVTSCFQLLDMCQLMFRYMSGLEAYKLIGDTGPIAGDLFFRLFQKIFLTGSLKGGMWGTDGDYSVLAITFWSLVIIGALMLLVTTIAAIIRNEYNPDKEKKNSKAGIIKNFFKAIASFAIVPIASFFGLWLGNTALFAIDTVTTAQISSNLTSSDVKGNFVSDNGSYCYATYTGLTRAITGENQVLSMKYPSISGIVNKVCLYSANRIRCENGFYEQEILGGEHSLDVFDKASGAEKSAQLIDDAFALNARLKTSKSVNGITVEYLNRNSTDLIKEYYDLDNYNLILAVIYIFMGYKSLLGLTFGLVSRVIILLGLLFIEPIIISFMPLDNGGAFGMWRKQYLGRILSVFAALLAMNVFYIVCPIFLTINFFDYGWANGVVQTIFIIGLLASVSKLDQLFNIIILNDEKFGGAISASASGGEIYKEAKGAVDKVAKVGAGAARIGVGAAKVGAKVGVGAAKVGIRAGLAVGAAGFGAIQAGREGIHNIAGSIRGRKIANRAGTANQTDKDIFRGAAKKNYGEMKDKGARDAYAQYQKKAGDKAVSFKEWQEKTGEGSYFHRRSLVGTKMTDRQYFDKYHGGSDKDFEKWKKEGKEFKQQYKELGLRQKDSSNYTSDKKLRKKHGTEEEYTNKSEKKLKEIYANKSGVKTKDDIELKKKADASLAERSKARKEIKDLEKKIEKNQEKAESAKRLKRASVKKALKTVKGE